MATTTPTGLHIPTTGDVPNVPADLATLAADLDVATVPLFASTSARDTAYAAKPFGLCMVGATRDAATWYRRRAGAWWTLSDDATLTGGKQIRVGTTNVTLTSGAGTVTHGAGFTPVGVIVTPFLGTIFVGVGVTAITATTFSIRAFKSFTNADYFTGGALTIYWAAFA